MTTRKTHAHEYNYDICQWVTLCSRQAGLLAREGKPTCLTCRRILASAMRKERKR